jgi:pyruvate/2-oxoglutarate dehydrogenase complex dihydrolipoamide acyltransferase (E2) component
LVVPDLLTVWNRQNLQQISAAVKVIQVELEIVETDEMDEWYIYLQSMFGIEGFTSIINQPNSAILSKNRWAETDGKNGDIYCYR